MSDLADGLGWAVLRYG